MNAFFRIKKQNVRSMSTATNSTEKNYSDRYFKLFP